MRFNKEPLTYSQQADQLINRGLIASEKELIEVLKQINYYRLSGYFYHFYKKGSEKFIENTTLKMIIDNYEFDRSLRIILFKYLECVEIGIRTIITYTLSHKYSPFILDDRNNFPNLNEYSYKKLIRIVDKKVDKSKELFIGHFIKKHSDCHPRPPLWMLVEILSFGNIINIYEGVHTKPQKTISREFNLVPKDMKSWLLSMSILRNCIAHHNRVWHKKIRVKPKKVKKKYHPELYSPYEVDNSTLFGVICVMQYFYKILTSKNDLRQELTDLQNKYGFKLLKECGFPDNWQNSPIW